MLDRPQLGVARPALALAGLPALALASSSQFATVIALSNSEIAPSTWRTSLAVGVSSMKGLWNRLIGEHYRQQGCSWAASSDCGAACFR
jgi:hypothetical protein